MAEQGQSNTQQGRAVVAIALIVGLLAAAGLYLAPPSNALGEVYRHINPENASSLNSQSELNAAEIHTGQGERLGIELRNGANLRLDEHSQIALHSESLVNLTQGRLYWDAGVMASGRHIRITTRNAQIRAKDAQLEVATRGGKVHVRLRSGSGEFEVHDTGVKTALQREATLIYADSSIAWLRPAASEASWTWVHELAPTPATGEVDALELLEWLAHETGRTLDFANGASAQFLRNSALSNEMDRRTPEQSLQWLTRNADFGARIRVSDTAIMVR